MSAPIYAIGDIHGQIHGLEVVLERIAADGGSEAEIVFLGDYTDRGPDSRAVVQRLIDGVDAGRPWHVLRGNHDRMFCRFVAEGVLHDDRILSGRGWLDPALGGATTLASYGVEADQAGDIMEILEATRSAVPDRHIAFLADRDLTLERDGKLFVHAGVRPGVTLQDQHEDDLVWIREPFLSHTDAHPWLIVHGHTALDHPSHFGNRIDLDGGAGYGRPLHAAVFEGTEAWVLTEAGRAPLRP
ncbi:MAG: metallophosphoesterase [Pseudomonadota bacterium]